MEDRYEQVREGIQQVLRDIIQLDYTSVASSDTENKLNNKLDL